ncbi:MAG: hypothetical protein EXQ94_05085 [Alphaproteobacteria bacterium]|nr:hypothetical protein [Alphaproteobacteria bacterium]
MLIDILEGAALHRLNGDLGTKVVPGRYRREVASLHRVAGRPRSVAVWNVVGDTGDVAFSLKAAEYQAFADAGIIRPATE